MSEKFVYPSTVNHKVDSQKGLSGFFSVWLRTNPMLRSKQTRCQIGQFLYCDGMGYFCLIFCGFGTVFFGAKFKLRHFCGSTLWFLWRLCFRKNFRASKNESSYKKTTFARTDAIIVKLCKANQKIDDLLTQWSRQNCAYLYVEVNFLALVKCLEKSNFALYSLKLTRLGQLILA